MPYDEVPLRVVFLGDEGVGKSSLITRFSQGTHPVTRRDDDDQLARRVVDGVPVRFESGLALGGTKRTEVVVLVYDVNDQASVRSLGEWVHIVESIMQTDERVVFAGTKTDLAAESSGDEWLETIKQVGELLPGAPHILTSSKNDANVEQLFEAVARLYFLGELEAASSEMDTGASLVPRWEYLAHARTWAASQTVAHRYHRVDPPIFVVVSNAQVTEITKNRNEIPPGIIDEMLLWLPGKAASYKTVFVRAKKTSGRAFFHGEGDYAGARSWLASKLQYGILPDVESGAKYSVDVLRQSLAAMSPLLEHGRTRDLRLWGDEASVSLHNASAAAMVTRSLASKLLWERPSRSVAATIGVNAHPLWAAADRAVAAARQEATVADFSVVEFGAGVPEGRTYSYLKSERLGEGAFGCVLRILSGKRGSFVALKVQGMEGAGERSTVPQISEVVGAKHEIALMKHINHIVKDVTKTSPFVLPIFDGYITKPLPKTTSNKNVQEAIRLADHAASMCRKLTRKDLALGLVVTEMPVANVGDVNGEGANTLASETQRRAWSFQLIHGLASMNLTFGFVHQDIKPDNVLVFSGSSVFPSARRLRVRWRTASGIIDDVVVDDTSETVAVLADFGLGISNRASLLGYDGPSGLGGRNGDKRHAIGTLHYLDPLLGVYFDPNLPDNDAINARYTSFRARGIAGDVWALGLVLLNVWMQDPVIGAEPKDFKGEWNLRHAIAVGGESDSMRLFREDVMANVTVQEGEAKEYMRDVIDTENPEGSGFTYMFTFLHAILLYRAFHDGAWPEVRVTDNVEPGPYWRYISANRAALEKAAGKTTQFDIIAERLRTTQPNVYDFIARCLAWDPEDRVRFLTEGQAFAHEMFRDKDSDLLQFSDYEMREGGEPVYMLDLASPVARGPMDVPEDVLRPPPGTPQPKPRPAPKPKPKPAPKPVPKPTPKRVEPKPAPKPVPKRVEPKPPTTRPRPKRTEPRPEPIPRPGVSPEVCQTPTVVEIDVEENSPHKVIEMLADTGGTNDLYIFDFDGTLATRPSKIFPEDFGTPAKMRRKVRDIVLDSKQILKKFMDDPTRGVIDPEAFYGPSNITELSKLPGGRVYVVTARTPRGTEAVEKVLAAAGASGVEVIGTQGTGLTKSQVVMDLLREKNADTVHFVDNSPSEREGMEVGVTLGAHTLAIYDVNLTKYIRSKGETIRPWVKGELE